MKQKLNSKTIQITQDGNWDLTKPNQQTNLKTKVDISYHSSTKSYASASTFLMSFYRSPFTKALMEASLPSN